MNITIQLRVTNLKIGYLSSRCLKNLLYETQGRFLLKTHGCSNCFLEYLKMGADRRRIEQQFYDQGISIHEFF